MSNKSELDKVFFPISKAVIFIPIVTIIIALFLKGSEILSDKTTAPQPTPTLALSAEIPIPTTVVPTVNTNIDLKGPYRCGYESAEASSRIFIKDKQLYAQLTEKNETRYMLLKEDCFYGWQNGRGEKACGFSQLMGMYEAMSAIGAVDFSGILKMLSTSGLSQVKDEAAINKMIESCKKEGVADSIFTIPTNINFNESDALKNLL